jgi:uncharacterized protein (TIGR02145 family)
MKKISYTIFALFLLTVMSNGQVVMNIFQKGGITNQIMVNNVDSIIFSGLTVPDAVLPTITTNTIYSITSFLATVGCSITNDGGASITSRGVCWSTNTDPTVSLATKTDDGLGTDDFSSSLTGLQPLTTYYVRAYATNSKGTSYGSTKSFTTLSSSGTVTDIDGNVYQTITIGTQVWMAENLKTTKYRDGTSIPNVTDANQWGGLTTGAYCDYNNVVSNSTTYGRLYNWYAVSDSRNIAPAGWHVPTDAEWTTLTTCLGGESVAGGKLKEAGTAYWLSPNTCANNEIGFTALPSGWLGSTFYDIGNNCTWWSATADSDLLTHAWIRELFYNFSSVGRITFHKSGGYSVRCIKDL